ncbi:uncharacterized protein [Misgurnus anguillicaudatus]|uniref:uncharacterized protein isoform X1 n=1 Tax=Misgurnus anguillicaudatus TaxID=75329 RepID=UPI003CCFC838
MAHCADVSNISISAKDGSNISAPVLSNLEVKGNINITNYFTDNVESGAETTDTVSLIAEYKSSILLEYAYLTEHTSRAGEQVLLNDRYSDPMIVHKHREREEKEQEMLSRGDKFFISRTNQRNKSISLNQLFSPESEAKKGVPRAVILQGDSGSGKSITALKILLDWASGELYAELFDVVFYLRCQELSGLSGEMSLVEVLDCSLTQNEITQILKDKSQKTLFIVDGFDELVLSSTNKSLPPKPNIKAHPTTILCSLLKGRMMRDSFLLVTTRSAAVDKLEGVLKKPQSFMEILGFSEKGVMEYFQKFFEDEEFSKQVYEQVRVHEMLYTVCFVPVFCWIICTIFKKKGKAAIAASELTTTTSIFVDFTVTMLKHHSSLSHEEQFNLLKSLGQLAESGTPKRQILFRKSSLPKEISGIPNVPFLCTFRQQERTFLKEMVGFMHLSFQEFFTALSYLLTNKSEVKIKVKELLELAGNGRHNDHLLPVIRFLFGLSNKKVSRLFVGEQQRSASSVIRAQLEKWIGRVLVKNIMNTFYMSDFILHCLYELHDKDILKNVMRLWEKSGIHIHWTLKRIDCQVIMFCLQYSKQISRLELRCNAEHLKALHSAISRCYTLWLEFESMSDTDVDVLISGLGTKKEVGYLKMQDGDLSDESVQKILKSILGQQSVGDIRLSVRTISYDNANLIMNFLIKEMMGKEFSICIASQAETREESLCSEFTVKTQKNSCWLTVGHSEEDEVEILKQPGVGYYQAFSKISFAISTTSEISTVDWRDFLKISNNLRCFSNVKDVEFGENLDLLLSFLNSVPGLTEVDIHATYLTEIWTSRILSYLHVNPKISCVMFNVKIVLMSDVERVCSTFCVSRKPFVRYKMHDSEKDNPSLILSLDRWAYDAVRCSSGKPVQSHPHDTPALVKLNLSVPPLEGSRFTWEKLFQETYQLIQLIEKPPDLEERVDSLLVFLDSVPGLKKIQLWLNYMNEIWAAGLFSLFVSRSSLLHLELKTSLTIGVESLGMIRHDGIKLSVGCNHLNYIDDYDISFIEPPVHKMLPCIALMIPDKSESRNADWKKFFHAYNQLKVLTENCPEYDERVNDLLSALHSVSGLKFLDLVVKFMTVDGASRVLDLIHTNPSVDIINFLAIRLPETPETDFSEKCGNSIFRRSKSEDDSDEDRFNGFGFRTAGQLEDSDDEVSLSSSLSDSSNESSDCDELDDAKHFCSSEILCTKIRVHKMSSGSDSASKWRIILKCTASSSDTQSPLTCITLTLFETSGKPNTDWRDFLWAYNQCKGISTMSSLFNERVDELLLSLYSVSGLIELNLSTDTLTENWAPKIISMCYTYLNLQNICLQVEYNRRESDLNVCSSINITKNITDSMVTIDISAAHKKIRTIPSFISFTSPCSTILKLDGHELLQTLDLLKGLKANSEEHEEYVDDLMAILFSVPDLQKVAVYIGNLTEMWVKRILSFAEGCPGLQEIRCNCIEDAGLVLEEHVALLQNSQMDSDCMIMITGKSSCSEKVELTFCKNSLSTNVLKDESEFDGDIECDEFDLE